MSSRPFQVLGVHHIAIGGSVKERLLHLWMDLLGLQSVDRFQSEAENVDEEILVAGSGAGAVEIDLMQPLDPTRKPNVAVPALNHVGLSVDNLEAAVAWLSASGVRFAPGGIRRGAGGADVAFIHPAPNEAFPVSGEGVLIELIQAK